jgi:hypothetical protein
MKEVRCLSEHKYEFLRLSNYPEHNAAVGSFAEAAFHTHFPRLKDVSAMPPYTHDYELGHTRFDVKGSERGGRGECRFVKPKTLPLESDVYVFIKVSRDPDDDPDADYQHAHFQGFAYSARFLKRWVRKGSIYCPDIEDDTNAEWLCVPCPRDLCELEVQMQGRICEN